MISPEFVVSLKGGKSFPVYAGVLDAAHRAGLRQLTTELLQAPAEENHWTAIVKARAVLVDESGEKIFEEIGDASPANTSDHLVSALIRLAATRAKGRALRDAVNIGQALLEELPPEAQMEAAPPRRQEAVVPARRTTPVGRPANGNAACDGCGVSLRPAQAVFSQRNFGGATLCMDCRPARSSIGRVRQMDEERFLNGR